MKKMSFDEIRDLFFKHNKENNITQQWSDKNPLYAVIVFDNKSFDRDYPLESRSYRFRSDNKGFIYNMLSNSIWAPSLDETDYIRIDWYLDDWIVEYCYIEEQELKI